MIYNSSRQQRKIEPSQLKVSVCSQPPSDEPKRPAPRLKPRPRCRAQMLDGVVTPNRN
jgi:hypothetical protein